MFASEMHFSLHQFGFLCWDLWKENRMNLEKRGEDSQVVLERQTEVVTQ